MYKWIRQVDAGLAGRVLFWDACIAYQTISVDEFGDCEFFPTQPQPYALSHVTELTNVWHSVNKIH